MGINIIQTKLSESESRSKDTQGKTNYMRNRTVNEYILIEHGTKENKWQNTNTSDKLNTSKTPQKNKSMPGTEQHGAVLVKKKKN